MPAAMLAAMRRMLASLSEHGRSPLFRVLVAAGQSTQARWMAARGPGLVSMKAAVKSRRRS